MIRAEFVSKATPEELKNTKTTVIEKSILNKRFIKNFLYVKIINIKC